MRRFILIIMTVAICFGTYAQDKPQRLGKKSQHEAIFNKLHNEKIAFFTSEIDLTPEEAQQFWPVYNQFLKETQNAHTKSAKALQALKNRSGEKLTEAELQKRIDEYVASIAAQDEVFVKYAVEFKKVLPMEKVAKLYVAEEKFRIKMIRRFRDKGSGQKSSKDYSDTSAEMEKN
jgi:hypothetical protein